MTIESTLHEVARSYPGEMATAQLADIERIAFHIRLSLDGRDAQGLSICDIGGGVGLFSPGCAALGMTAMLIDDFADQVNRKVGDAPFVVHRKYGVRIESRDVIARGVADIGERFDIVTTFDSMEHWHHSPKTLFRQVCESLLKPGGRLVIGAPNCVNLRKRITVPFGIGKWSSMADWYEEPVFRGHVREPDVKDLLYVSRDIKLRNVRLLGRNWLGYASGSAIVRIATRTADLPMRVLPSLCSDLYLVGHV